MLVISACASAERGPAFRTAVPMRTGPDSIYATACRPEWCYRDLGQVKSVEALSEAAIDRHHIDATERLKKLAAEEYGGEADAIIRLRATMDPLEGAVVVSGEAVRADRGKVLGCALQIFVSAVINLACDSQREGVIGDADEYERLYESLP